MLPQIFFYLFRSYFKNTFFSETSSTGRTNYLYPPPLLLPCPFSSIDYVVGNIIQGGKQCKPIFINLSLLAMWQIIDQYTYDQAGSNQKCLRLDHSNVLRNQEGPPFRRVIFFKILTYFSPYQWSKAKNNSLQSL